MITMKKLLLLLIFQSSVLLIYSQSQEVTIDLRNLQTADYPINSITFNTVGLAYRMNNSDSISFKVDYLPTMVSLCILKKNKFHTQRIIWIDKPNILLKGSIESPENISISPTSYQQEVVDNLTPIITKNKNIDSELAFTKPYLIYLVDNVGFKKPDYIERIILATPDSLKGFWATKYLEKYLDDLENIGYEPENRKIKYITAINKSKERQKIEISGDKYTLLDFSSSGCGPCIKGIDQLSEIYKNKHEKLEIIMIWNDKSFDGWVNIAKKQKDKINWISLLDENGAIHSAFNIKYLPMYMLVDSDGYIVDKCTGKSLNYIEKYINEHL